MQITILHAVPPVVLFLAKHPLVSKFDLSALKYMVSGAAPLGVGLTAEAQDRLGFPIYQGTVFPHFWSTKVQYFLTVILCLLIPIRTDWGLPSTKVHCFLTSHLSRYSISSQSSCVYWYLSGQTRVSHLPRYSISSLPIYQGTVFSHFSPTKIQYFPTSHLPGYCISSQTSFVFTDTYQDRLEFPIYQGTVFPHFPSTRVQCFLTVILCVYWCAVRTDWGFPFTKVQYFLTSDLPRYSISSLPIYQDTVFPHFPSTKIQYFLTSHLPGYCISSQTSFVFTDTYQDRLGFPIYQGTVLPHFPSTKVQYFLTSHLPRYSISSPIYQGTIFPHSHPLCLLMCCQDRLGFPINQGTVFPHSRHWTVLILCQPVRTDWGFPSIKVAWHHFMQSHIRSCCCVCVLGLNLL